MTTGERLAAGLADRYRVERELGQGGMATVYLAHDLRHDRKVALKVLRPELAAVIGAERFLAEIKTTANLQHPHILPLFDSGRVDGSVFYVMPFVQGESLRDRLARDKQLPIEEAVRIAREVADALAAAHAAGIIHRDIKPENILLQGNHALVADFGIALAASRADGTGRMTETGMSLGTPHYMSPEQALGERTLDARTDIYALGCVLYEMLVGEPPFTGPTAQAILARVMNEEPRPLSAQRSTISEGLESAVLCALAKLPADRPASTTEFALMLGGQSMGRRDVRRPPAVRKFTRPAFLATALVSLLAAGALGAWLGRGMAPRTAPLGPVRFLFSGSDDAHAILNTPWSAAISPDGRTIVYTVQDAAAGSLLYSRRMDQLDGHPMPGTTGASQPIFSPDGDWIAYLARGKAMRVRLDGSDPVTVGPWGTENGAVWTTIDELVFGSRGPGKGLSHVPVSGGNAVEFTRPDSVRGETEHIWPVALPDGKTVVFAIWTSTLANSELAIATLDGGNVTPLGVRGIRPLAVLDGELVYLDADGVVLAIPLDVPRRRIAGSPVRVHDPVFPDRTSNGNADIYIAPDGGMVLGIRTRGVLSWIGRDGSARPIEGEVKDFSFPRLSPDGRRLAVIVGDGARSDVWIRDLEAGTMSRLTTVETVTTLEWAYDGTRVVYTTQGKDGAIWAQAIGTDSPPEKLAAVPATYASLAPDNHSLLLETWNEEFPRLERVLLDSGGVRRSYLFSDKGLYYGGPISPDGRWAAVTSTESGTTQVYIRSYPDPVVKLQVSVGGGASPRWSADGMTVYYVSGATLIGAKLATTPTLRVASRDTLISRLPNLSGSTFAPRQVTLNHDGSRVIAPVAGSAFAIEVVPNWISEFRERRAAARTRVPQ